VTGGTWLTELPAMQGTGAVASRPLTAAGPRAIYRVRVELP
jgi:hypothetical protein